MTQLPVLRFARRIFDRDLIAGEGHWFTSQANRPYTVSPPTDGPEIVPVMVTY